MGGGERDIDTEGERDEHKCRIPRPPCSLLCPSIPRPPALAPYPRHLPAKSPAASNGQPSPTLKERTVTTLDGHGMPASYSVGNRHHRLLGAHTRRATAEVPGASSKESCAEGRPNQQLHSWQRRSRGSCSVCGMRPVPLSRRMRKQLAEEWCLVHTCAVRPPPNLIMHAQLQQIRPTALLHQHNRLYMPGSRWGARLEVGGARLKVGGAKVGGAWPEVGGAG